MTTPKRIRLSRAKGWSIKAESPNYVIVDRRGAWGNPWTICQSGKTWHVLRNNLWPSLGTFDTKERAQAIAVDYFRQWLTDDDFAATLPKLSQDRDWILRHLHLLDGKDLCCWCHEGTACHANVYFELLAAHAGGEE